MRSDSPSSFRPGCQSRSDQRFDLSCIDLPRRTRLQEGSRLKLQHAQYARQLLESCSQRRRGSQIRLTQAVHLTNHLEQHGAAFRRVEVVIHRRSEARNKLIAAGRLSLRQALKPL